MYQVEAKQGNIKFTDETRSAFNDFIKSKQESGVSVPSIREGFELALYSYSKSKEKAIDQENLIIKNALFIKDKTAFIRINFSDIHYLKSEGNYIDVQMIDGKRHTVRGSLNDYIAKLNTSFARCHRSYILNLDLLESIDTISIISLGVSIPLGKQHRNEILERLNMV